MTYPFFQDNRFALAGIEVEADNVSTGAIRTAFDNASIDWCKIEIEHCGVEIVFPPMPLPLTPDSPQYQDVKLVLDTLASVNANVGRAGIGGHVHIGNTLIDGESPANYWANSKRTMAASLARNGDAGYYESPHQTDEMPVALIKDVIRRYATHQSDIDAHLPPSRTDCRWCWGLSRLAAGGSDNAAFEAATTIDELRGIIHDNGSKYRAINLQSYNNGTIEFRQGASSLEIEKWAAWCNLILGLFQHSDHYRIDWSTLACEAVVQSPDRLHRAGSRLDVTYQLCRRDGGATVRDIMAATGCQPQRIRAMITEIRQHPDMSDDMVETLTQQHYNHRYGTSGGRYDQGGYEVYREVVRSGAGIHGLLPENRIGQTSIFAGLDDDSFEVLAARRLARIERGTLTR